MMTRHQITRLLLVAVLATGCGSTVQVRSTSMRDGQVLGSDGSQIGGADAGPGSGQQSTQSSSALPGTATRTAGNATGAAVDAPVGQVTTGGSQRPAGAVSGWPDTGRGFTKTKIYLGVPISDATTYAKALGINGIDAGDTMALYKAIVDDINSHGGIAGRHVEIVVHQFSTAQEVNDPATANQEACTDWTQDHHVFAVLNGGYVIEDVLLACLAKADTPLIGAGGIDAQRIYQPTYTKYPMFFNVGDMLGETYDRISIRRLVARNFFQRWDTSKGAPGSAPMKVGILMHQGPEGDHALASLEQQLARYGIKPASVVRVRTGSQGSADASNAQLRFKTLGITHIVSNPGLAFMETAKQQGYYPRYFLPAALQVYASTAPAGQLTGAMAEDYVPAYDVAATEYPGDPTPAAAHCRNIMTKAKQDISSPSVLWAMQFECDEFFFVRAAVDVAGGLSTAAVLARGFDSLGSRAQSAMTWKTSFGPSQHASTQALRDLAWDSSCTCWRFTSKQDHI
jgi:hypothetical protein